MEPTAHSSEASRQPPPSLEEVSAAFPQLEILELIGQGGMGCVFKARQPKLNRLVALKLLPASLAERDAAFAGRFEREGQLLARLHHPNIVAVHDSGTAGEFFYLIMEFVDGVNLRQAMRARRFTPVQALAIVPHICDALQYAHDEGVLHRDIKPENILLDAKGRVKLADFGIAKLLAESEVPANDAAPADAGLTHAGTALGTPSYMSPEQRDTPADVDHRADIYSLGVVFYELLTGELPQDPLARPSAKSAADPRVDAIVQQALEKERGRRQHSAGEVKTQVETVVATPGGSQGGEAQVSSAPPRFRKIGSGTLSTPELLATAEGQFFAYRTRGQLILDERQLTHSRTGVDTVIPLAAIRDLSLGRYPRTMAPAGIDLISLSFEEGGQRRQVLLFPMQGWFGFPSSANAHVAEWLVAIREAVTAATGHTPGSTPADKLGVPSSSRSVLVLTLGAPLCALLVLTGSLIYLAIMRQTPGAPTTFPFNINPMWVVFALPFLFPLVAFRLPWLLHRRARKGSSSATVSGQAVLPPDSPASTPRYSRMAIVGAVWFGVALVGILTVAGPIQKGLPWWQTLLSLMILLPTVSAPFGTTILGWVAVSQIRRSAGRLHGLRLAVADGLMFPLLLLDGLLGGAWWFIARWLVDFLANEPMHIRALSDPEHVHLGFVTRLANDLAHHGTSSVLFVFGAAVTAIAADYFIIRAVWRAVRRLSANSIANAPAAPLKTNLLIPLVPLVRNCGSGRKAVTLVVAFTLAALIGYRAWSMAGGAPIPWSPSVAVGLIPAAVFVAILMVLVVRNAVADRKPVRLAVGMLGLLAIAVAALMVFKSMAPQTDLIQLAANDPARHFPSGAHIGGNHHSVMVTHDKAQTALHYVLYYAGDFGTTSSGTQNLVTKTWVDEGAVKLKNGRTFGYRREGRYPDELHVNGTPYDLRKGRVLVLRDDGTAEQLKLFPPLTVARDPEALAKLLTAPSASIPQHIEFKVLRVENPPGTRNILLHFERDSNYGLALEVWQDVTRLQGRPGPAPDQRDWRQKEWVGVNDPRVLRWALPQEFTPDEAKALAKEMERKWKGSHPLPDGAVPEFATALHRDGWKYHLVTKVLREPGSPRPPAPAGALFTSEQRINWPADALVRLTLDQSTNGGPKTRLGEELVFKTAPDRATGFVLRWHAYPAQQGKFGNQWILDLVDPDTGVIFHRVENRFAIPVKLISPDHLPLPEKNQSHILAEPGSYSPFHLLRAEQPGPPGAAITAWWDLQAVVEFISPTEKGVVPAFQLPSLPAGGPR
ncbi:MAG: protein kinase domain-containing protein [Prosthecobacter sp.]|uniref:serine/threonine-protein kinase n=1 Tax=Prosthecobacter sp. TaxID=1965333 RepID=UPI003900BA5A